MFWLLLKPPLDLVALGVSGVMVRNDIVDGSF